MRQGKIFVGIVDRISEAPPEENPVNKRTDTIRAVAFGRPVGVVGWPTRFAKKCKAPILPVMVAQTPEAVALHIGDASTPGCPAQTTQVFVSLPAQFCRKFPMDWGFVYDKQWAQVLRDGRFVGDVARDVQDASALG